MTKDFIIAEIVRVAAEIGRTPGRDEFFNRSGIRETDWQGKFWARWSDAVTEAGFLANTLQGARSDEELLESLALFTRELGRFPTTPEMRMKRRADPAFPSDKTFERFGKRGDVAQRLREYCEGRLGYEDILPSCALTIASSRQAANMGTPEADIDKENLGFVYLIKSGKHYKIGRSNATGRRHREIAIQLPERAVLIHEISTDDPVGIEAYWHLRFAAQRKNGEWFELTKADIAAFRRRRFM